MNKYSKGITPYYNEMMNNKNYLSTYSEPLKKSGESTPFKASKMPDVDIEGLATSLIEQQNQRTKQLQMQIKAYQVQVQAEKNCRVDHGPYIQAVEEQINSIKAEEAKVGEQIRNCQMVEGQVTPMEYYLWKKKQRINTYDASIAELCKEIEAQREWMENSSEQLRNESEQLTQQIQQLEEKFSQMNTSSPQFLPHRPSSEDVDCYEQLFAQNIELKEQYSNLQNTHQFLQENKDIVAMQISDNIKSIEATLKGYFDGEKKKLVGEFKQIQIESKSKEVSALNNEEQHYKIDPLLNDYAYKLKEIYATVPQNMKKNVNGILQPLAWEKFYWRDFLEIEPKSEQIYSEHRKLENEYMQNESAIEKLQEKIKQLSHQLVMQQMRSTDFSQNIPKMRKKVKK